MTIDYQVLREAAERAIPEMELLTLPFDAWLSKQELKDYGVDIDVINTFRLLAGPETMLELLDEIKRQEDTNIDATCRISELETNLAALVDERERNQQYIKRRDQENEEIALTVGKLRVELEGKDRRITELTMWIKRLSSSLKNAKPDSKLPDDAMIWLNNEGLTSIEDILR
ncbi:ead/Ea22-like family protein [Escherichia coli]|nr:ead/Ea22-like family protein [Escherichia coli]